MRFLSFAAACYNKNVLKIYKRAGAARSGVAPQGQKERFFCRIKDEALGTQPIGKLMLSLALPAVAAQFINMLYNIVDRIYIGNIPVQAHLR